MHRAVKIVLFLSLLASVGSTIAQNGSNDAAAKDEQRDAVLDNCFDVTRAKDIAVINDQHLYVRTYAGNQYLVTTTRICENLLDSYRTETMAISPYGRRVCTNDGSHIIYTWSGRQAVCPIGEVARVDSRATARALAESGSTGIKGEAVPAPERQE